MRDYTTCRDCGVPLASWVPLAKDESYLCIACADAKDADARFDAEEARIRQERAEYGEDAFDERYYGEH